MKRYRKTLTFLLIVIVLIQFIQPKKNLSNGIAEHDISKAYVIPEHVHQTFTQKCYDCHSNHTDYPWYFNVQPIGWWLAAHIYDGKQNLNFSEFKKYEQDQAEQKLNEIVDAVISRNMPMGGYVFLRPHTRLTDEDEQAIISWAKSAKLRGN
ncbi:MAG TPA: heme-binding domain-containing protein [Chryseosolibacter sp.]|nr:heme-binding domain-containing protein [Chryseosolibacter sp.]